GRGFLEQGRGGADRPRPETACGGGLFRLPGRPVQQVILLHPARLAARWGRAGAAGACPCFPLLPGRPAEHHFCGVWNQCLKQNPNTTVPFICPRPCLKCVPACPKRTPPCWRTGTKTACTSS